VDIQIESLEHLKNRSKLFLDDHREIMMNIESEKIHSRGFQYSKYSLQSLDKTTEPIDSLLDRMREEMKGFQNCLDDTEKVAHAVQNDMDDTRNRMGTYIKDIPQDFYSEVFMGTTIMLQLFFVKKNQTQSVLTFSLHLRL
jgi:hypothetical protein